MTGALTDTIYPQYCFHLSPTINRWCPLRAQQVYSLDSHPGFEGQDLYFSLNHPIKWVRLVGIVVAMDEWSGSRVYTIDDSSGMTMECVVNIPKNTNGTALQPTKPKDAAAVDGKATVAAAQSATAEEDKNPVVDREIGVGDVLDVRGSIMLSRFGKKIKVAKIIHLRSTADEVQFWNKLAHFRTDVLSQPWSLTEKEIRRCRREAEGLRAGKAERHREKEKEVKRKVREGHSKGSGLDAKRAVRKATPVVDGGTAARARATGLERRPKRPKTVRVEGRYGALGI